MDYADLPNGIRIAYQTYGDEDAIPLLLIMGIGAQMIHWPDGFCEALAAEGFRVIRYDNRDVGESTFLDHEWVPSALPAMARFVLGLPVKAPYALEDMAEDAALLVEALGYDDVHVLGTSLGGMIAQTMAIVYPHRMRSLVSLMSSTGKSHRLMSTPGALKALLAPSPRNEDEAVMRGVEFSEAVGSTGFAQDLEGVKYRALLAWRRGNYPPGFLRQLAAVAATGDREPRLAFVRVPTLVIHGTVDPLVRPFGGQRTADSIPGARLEWVDGLGHDLPPGAWPTLVEKITGHARVNEPASI